MPVDENEFFRQVTVRMASSLELDVALRRTMAYLTTQMPVRSTMFAMIEPTLGAVQIVAIATAKKGLKLNEVLQMPREVQPLLKKHWENMSGPDVLRVEEIRDELERPLVELIMAQRGSKTAGPIARELGLELPAFEVTHLVRALQIGRERIGALVLESQPQETFAEEHVRLVELMNEPCAIAVSNALKLEEVQQLKDMLREENRFLRRELRQIRGEKIIGREGGLVEVMDLVHRVAPLDAPVLLLGETGVGKEVIAAAIHRSSQRADGPFITVNCGAIPETLIDSELFGHEKGAFTGASGVKKGRFERAQGGTIFLDEIGELPLASQVRLLRVLQSREVERVGGQFSISLDIRVIAATHRDLRAMVRAGRFREDLLFRLDVFPISIPPLRDRLQDIAGLVRHFVQLKSSEQRIADPPKLDERALDQLLAYHWPGNVRELANVVERAMILDPEGPISFDWLDTGRGTIPPDEQAMPAWEPRLLDEVMAEHIRRVLEHTGGKISGSGGAAEVLGLHPNTLRARMTKLGLSFGRGEQS